VNPVKISLCLLAVLVFSTPVCPAKDWIEYTDCQRALAKSAHGFGGLEILLSRVGGCHTVCLMKTVGLRERIPGSPGEAVRRAGRLIAAANELAGQAKPRGFVIKAKTWAEMADWKRVQVRPRV